MGTNYYVKCKCCDAKLRHIGKQSAGWKFKSNIPKEEFVKMLEIESNQKFVNEYGEDFTKEQLIEKVTEEWELMDGGKYWDSPDAWC